MKEIHRLNGSLPIIAVIAILGVSKSAFAQTSSPDQKPSFPEITFEAQTVPTYFTGHDVQKMIQTLMEINPIKSQFETSPEWKNRVATAFPTLKFGGLGVKSTFAFRPTKIEKRGYDADTQTVTLRIDTVNDCHRIRDNDINILTKEITDKEDRYQATNSYGASITVHRGIYTQFSVDMNQFSRANRDWCSHDDHGIIFKFAIAPDKARDTLEHLSILILSDLETSWESFLRTDKNQKATPTFDLPFDLSFTTFAIRAKAKAVLIYNDTSGEVVWKHLVM